MAKPKRGRPRKGADALLAPVTVRFPAAMMREIEAVMSSRMDEPDKGQVIRELVAAGLELKGKRK